jgi:hypothetical protein
MLIPFERYLYIILHDYDGRILVQIRTNKLWIRIQILL